MRDDVPVAKPRELTTSQALSVAVGTDLDLVACSAVQCSLDLGERRVGVEFRMEPHHPAVGLVALGYVGHHALVSTGNVDGLLEQAGRLPVSDLCSSHVFFDDARIA